MDFKKKIKTISTHFNIILLVDELEHLLNKDKQNFELIVEFFNINSKGFIKIGISNTLDLFNGVQKNAK